MIWQTMKMMVPMMTAAMLHRHIWTTVMIWQTMRMMVPMMTVAMFCASFVLDLDILFLNLDAIYAIFFHGFLVTSLLHGHGELDNNHSVHPWDCLFVFFLLYQEVGWS